MKPRFIDIDGRRYLWSHLLDLRRAQLAKSREAQQPTLFELHLDIRPHSERSAVGRYREPGLFDP
jgi:hypothetical protein